MTEREISDWECEINHAAKIQEQRKYRQQFDSLQESVPQRSDRIKALFDETDDRPLETQAIEQAKQDRIDLIKRLIISFFLLFVAITVLNIGVNHVISRTVFSTVKPLRPHQQRYAGK